MRARLWLLAILAMAALPAGAQAWLISQVEPATGAGIAESAVYPLYKNSTSDTIEIHKYFMETGASLVLKFTRQTGDHNTIKIADEWVMNLVPSEEDYEPNWDNYNIFLVSDPNVGNPKVWFKAGTVKAWQQTGGQTRLGGLPSTVFYDANTRITGYQWATEDPSQMVPYGGFGDAPYNQLIIRGMVIDVSQVPVNGSFYLKQIAYAPEPASLVIIGCGLAAVVLRRRYRFGRRS